MTCQIFLLALLALFFTPGSGLIDAGPASAQSRNPQHRYAKRVAPRKRLVVRQRYRAVRKPKQSFLGGLFASKPQRRRTKTVKPLFGNFQLKIPGISPKSPAVLRANYEKRMRAAARRGQNPSMVRGYAPVRDGARNRGLNNRPDPRSAARGWGRGKYRTMCVRLCDGYYFPVSFRAGSRKFTSDEQRCNSECYNAPTKLFYYSNPGGSIKNMRALDGERYKDMVNAFKYRKEFVADCRCKAEPWTAQAKQQHESWATEKENSVLAPDTAANAPDVALPDRVTLDREATGASRDAKMAQYGVRPSQY